MKIDHIAIWTSDLEKVKDYYIKYFGARSNDKYINPQSGMNSYFLSFGEGPRIEIMYRPDIPDNLNDTVTRQHKGIIHLAFEVKTMAEVEDKARQLSGAGYAILRGPRKTGDGYYEFETIDPENNRLEVMAKYED